MQIIVKQLQTTVNTTKKDGVTFRDTVGRVAYYTLISQSDLFRLIIKSKSPSAEKFENWVMEELLPQVTKTGEYQVNNSERAEVYLDYCLKFEGALKQASSTMEILSQENVDLKLQNQTNEKQLAMQKPKVEDCERLELLEPTTTLREYGIIKLAHLFKRAEETVPIDQWLENPPRIPFIKQSV
jgi:prophage antirepressor-like protein